MAPISRHNTAQVSGVYTMGTFIAHKPERPQKQEYKAVKRVKIGSNGGNGQLPRTASGWRETRGQKRQCSKRQSVEDMSMSHRRPPSEVSR